MIDEEANSEALAMCNVLRLSYWCYAIAKVTERESGDSQTPIGLTRRVS